MRRYLYTVCECECHDGDCDRHSDDECDHDECHLSEDCWNNDAGAELSLLLLAIEDTLATGDLIALRAAYEQVRFGRSPLAIGS